MAIAYRQQVDDDTEFAIWKIEEEAEELYSQLQLDDDEKAYYEQLKIGKRNLHWLGTRVLLRKMLKTDEYIDCKVDAHGKPYLVNLPYHISLSHSFDYAAELAFIKPADKIPQLYVCWCAKEAVYKCYGQKEVSFLDNILLDPFQFEGHGYVNAHLKKGDICLDFDVAYLQYQDYMVGFVKGDNEKQKSSI